MISLALSLAALAAQPSALSPDRLAVDSPLCASGQSVHSTFRSSAHLTTHIVDDGRIEKPIDVREEIARECSFEVRGCDGDAPTRVRLSFGEVRDHALPPHDDTIEGEHDHDFEDTNPLDGRIFEIARTGDGWSVADVNGRAVSPSMAQLVRDEQIARTGVAQVPGLDFTRWLSGSPLTKGETRHLAEPLGRALLGVEDPGKLDVSITLASVGPFAAGLGDARFAVTAHCEHAAPGELETETWLSGELRVDARTGRPLVLELRGRERRLGAASDRESAVEIVTEGERTLARTWLWR